MSETINRTWFKNQLRKGNLLVKCTGKQTDDYAFDYAYKFFEDSDYLQAEPDYFNDWKLRKIHIWGDKNGLITVAFASCEYYNFKLKGVN